MAMVRLQDVCTFMENYWCRNQLYRTAQFSSAMLAGLIETSHPIPAGKLSHISNSISNMRVMLRLLDDLPALVHTIRTWRNKAADQSLASRCVDLLTSLCGLLYYPAEHIAWAADNHLIAYPSSPFWALAVGLWGISLLISALQSITALLRINKEMELLWKRERNSNSSPPDEKRVTFSDQKQYVGTKPHMRALMTRRFHIVLSLVQSLSDLMNAIHWLPEGFLWAGRLPPFWVGAFGTLSSIIGLYKIVPTQSV